MEKVKKKYAVSISEVKELLQNQEPEEMDQIQRWTFDYATKFAKLDGAAAKKMKKELVKDCNLTEEEAVELINIFPKTMSELRSFTFGWKKLILSETLEKILKIIKENS
jgi:DNA-directed RNA polymerase subunit F|tara:strand:+ start:110 stop:436 length:327 start_codon:yes stop_codon:yes gene_type:complete